jgi:hypothetical protein
MRKRTWAGLKAGENFRRAGRQSNSVSETNGSKTAFSQEKAGFADAGSVPADRRKILWAINEFIQMGDAVVEIG